jgi:N-formylglutamate amidohydrolase
MTDSYTFHSGTVPLLVSVPHDGRQLPRDIEALMSDTGKLLPDTDWHVARLYDFAKDLGASMITANYSRYVVDLNRSADDAVLYEGQLLTGLCPLMTFDGRDIYKAEEAIEVDDRVQQYWRPYHDKIEATLAGFRESHGYALLWDAHSIASRVPSLFDGELPVLNIGTWDGRSCEQLMSDAVMRVAQASSYSAVLNARFKGGHITRHYGDPGANVHALQLEVAQRAYMDEATTAYNSDKASQFRDTLKALLEALIETADDNAAIML